MITYGIPLAPLINVVTYTAKLCNKIFSSFPPSPYLSLLRSFLCPSTLWKMQKLAAIVGSAILQYINIRWHWKRRVTRFSTSGFLPSRSLIRALKYFREINEYVLSHAMRRSAGPWSRATPHSVRPWSSTMSHSAGQNCIALDKLVKLWTRAVWLKGKIC
jgi:hypothetical protein